jgi:hypothetical protein
MMTQEEMANKKAPVFVLGSPRSGTTLLYHMLLSSGGFAVYRTESKVYDLLVPQFGDLSVARNKRKLLEVWFQSKLFTLTGLDRDELKEKILADCRNGGDFLRIVMEKTARSQNMDRWAECTPEHILYLDRIRKELPDALVIHIIRDGRDVALSLEKQGWVHPFPWNHEQRLLVAGLYWEWLVGRGREGGRKMGANYIEVHFEDLLSQPHETLEKLGHFIGQDLDYDCIQRVGIGSASEPNTSFEGQSKAEFNPVGRWRKGFSTEDLASFEGLVGGTLEELGYPLASPARQSGNHAEVRRMRVLYRTFWDSKLWIKVHTPMSRLFLKTDPSEL